MKVITTINQNPMKREKSIISTKLNIIPIKQTRDDILHDYSTTQSEAYSLRNYIIEWLYRIHLKLEGDAETFFKAIYYLDKYIYNTKRVLDKRSLMLTSAVCLHIAFKFEEVSFFDLAFLKEKILHNKFTQKEIIETERCVLKTLKFKLIINTVQMYSNEFIFNSSEEYFKSEVFKKVNKMVNLITLLIDDLIFERDLYELAQISFKTTILLLIKNNKIVRGKIKDFELYIPSNEDDLAFKFLNLIVEEEKNQNFFMSLYYFS